MADFASGLDQSQRRTGGLHFVFKFFPSTLSTRPTRVINFVCCFHSSLFSFSSAGLKDGNEQTFSTTLRACQGPEENPLLMW